MMMLWRPFTSTTTRRYLAHHYRIVQRNKMTFPKLDKSMYILSNTYTQFNDKEVPFALGKNRSNALELVNAQPIIMVEGERAICDGGGGALGHPVEYISLQRPGEIISCIYCGLKYQSSGPSSGHHH